MRQPVLYAEQMWRTQRFWALFLIIAGVVASGIVLFQRHSFGGNDTIWLIYIPSGLLFLGVLQVYRRRHRIEIREEGLLVGNLLATLVIGYDRIRSARVQPLRAHYPDSRKRQGNVPVVRALLDQPALFVRLRADDQELAFIARKLGSRVYYDDTLGLPIPDPDAAAAEINARLPTRAAANMGGARPRRRRRR